MPTTANPPARSSLEQAAGRRTLTVVSVLVFLVVLVSMLAWAKWVPYAHKIPAAAGSRSLGVSILTGKLAAPPPPSLQAAVSYTVAYLGAIWPALVAGLLIAATLEAFLPPALLFRLLSSRAWGSAVIRGGACSLPSMMCTCTSRASHNLAALAARCFTNAAAATSLLPFDSIAAS